MVYSINMDYPGHNTEREITDLCDLIAKHGFSDILEFGPFGGRSTHAICTAFPDSAVTAVELMGPGIDLQNVKSPNLSDPMMGPQYSGLILTGEWFRSEHDFPNLYLVNDEMRFYRPEITRLFPEPLHDLVVVNLIPDAPYTFESYYDRALSFNPRMVIGMLRHHYPAHLDPVIAMYDCEMASDTLIRFKTKR